MKAACAISGFVFILAFEVAAQTLPPYAATYPIAKPIPFAPGRISAREHGCVTFAPDGRTVYFARHTPPPSTLMVSRFENGAWGVPQPLPFSGPGSGRVYDGDPAMSPDGSRLFFVSRRSDSGPAQIWSAKKQGASWSEPAPVADGLCGPSVAADGALYFCSDKPDSRGRLDLYRSRLSNGKYGPPENLGDSINTPHNDYDAYIAPDQSYLIFASDRPGGLGKGDLYVSFQRSGQWTPARHLGELVNSPDQEVCPVVSPDGKYFFYTRGLVGIFQVDIEALKLR